MKTLLHSTFIQLLLSITIFTILFATTTEVESFQISFFALSMIGLILPLALFNLLGLALLKFIVNTVKSANPKRTVLLTMIIFASIFSILGMVGNRPKDIFGITSAAGYFIMTTTYIFTMTAILYYCFARDFENDINSMKEE
jgi:hypothetical protein